MVSAIRLHSSVQEAARVAHTLSGLGSLTELNWMPPTVASSYVINSSDVDGSSEPSENFDEPALPLADTISPDSDNLVAEDDLDDAGDISDEDEIAKASALIQWCAPVSTFILLTCLQYQLIPFIQQNLKVDPITDYAHQITDSPPRRDIRPRVLRLSPPRLRDFSFGPDDIGRFISPTAELSGECINGGALLLQTQLQHSLVGFDAQSVALLSTHDLVRIRYAATDDQVWRNVKRTEFWSKDTWILPVHRPDAKHWVVCIIYPMRKTLQLFDSFADRGAWHIDVKVREYLMQLQCIYINS